MKIFIGRDFMIISGAYGDAIFNSNGIAVSPYRGEDDIVLDPTPECAKWVLNIIGGRNDAH